MQEPFDISVGSQLYAVFPEEEDVYTVFKNGEEYVRIQRDNERQWLKLDEETDLPVFNDNDEINQIGSEIQLHLDQDK